MKVILVTASGFIGRYTARSLLECRDRVIGLDNRSSSSNWINMGLCLDLGHVVKASVGKG